MREAVDRPPHRKIERQSQRDNLPVLLIEKRNSLQHESKQ